MSTEHERQSEAEARDQGTPTPQQVDEALRQAMRREAATREDLPADEQISDSGNQGGMGPQGAGHGRRSGRHS